MSFHRSGIHPSIHYIIHSFIHSFITYIAPLQDTTTQRRSQLSHGQRRRTWGRYKIWKGRSSARNAVRQGDHSMPMGPQPLCKDRLHQRRQSPLSQWCILHIPSISTKLQNFPLFPPNLDISPYFRTIYFFNLRFFASSYFDHESFIHHALHILDAPGLQGTLFWYCLPAWSFCDWNTGHDFIVHWAGEVSVKTDLFIARESRNMSNDDDWHILLFKGFDFSKWIHLS